MEIIEKVVYINLAHRTDRKEQVESELVNVFPSDKIVRFEAIKHENGGIGCSLSHVAVLELAIQNNWKNVLIVEDDLQWLNFGKGSSILQNLVRKPYDVILLSGAGVLYNSQTHKLNRSRTTTAYLVNNHYFQTLLENYKKGLELLKADYNNGIYRLDIYWIPLQKKDNWYIIPDMSIQRPSFSDVESCNVDYMNLTLEPVAIEKRNGFYNNIRFTPK